MKPRILFIIHLPPPVHGASLISTFIQQSQKIDAQFNCDYINLSTSRDLSDIGKMNFFKIFTFLSIYWKVFRAVSTQKYDLSFITLTAKTPVFYKDFIVVLILKLFRQKHVFLFNNKGVTESGRRNAFNNYLYRIALKNTPCIQNSQYLYEDISTYVNRKNVYFLPNGIPELINYPDKKTTEGQAQNTCKLLFLSNMMEEKGVYVFIEACRILKEQGVKFEGHFVGAWSDVSQEDFEARVRSNGLESNLFSHGKQYGEDKLKFYAMADVFVFPTYYHKECFPLVLLEAMQVGIPVISTREGGIPDIVADNETGYLVKRKDPVELAAKLRILIEDDGVRTAMGIAAKKRFDQRFRLENFEDNLSGILDDVIKKNTQAILQ